jgi:prephenate dehydrogenase
MEKIIQNVSIIGCGQVGTSILLAMAKQDKKTPAVVCDANKETEQLIRQKFSAEGFDLSFVTFVNTIQEAVSNADLVILATPIDRFDSCAREVAKFAKQDAIITDTGSAKKVAIENITGGIAGTDIQYVPAHPGNGSQGSGPLTSGAGNILGKNSTMFLIHQDGENFVPPEDSPEKRVQDFWNNMGVTTYYITTEKHDKFFGQCSHFQHALMFGLMNMALDNPNMLHNFQHAGTALRNMSRVAISQLKEGQPSALVQMWVPIFEQNKTSVLEAYHRFSGHLATLKDMISNDDSKSLEKTLKIAKDFRDGFDDPDRREVITGEIADIREIPKFHALQKGDLSALFRVESLPATASNLLLPITLAYAQTMSAKDIDPDFIEMKANPSFRDGTHPVTYATSYLVELVKAHKQQVLDLIENYEISLKLLMDGIEKGDIEFTKAFILDAQKIRNGMPAPRKNDAVRAEFEARREVA